MRSVLFVAVITLAGWAGLPALAQQAAGQADTGLDAASGVERVRLLNERAREIQADDPLAARAYAEEALELARTIGDQAGEVRSLHAIGISHYYAAEYDRAYEFYDQALKLAESLGDDEAVANALNNIGILYYVWGDYDKTLAYYSRALDLRRKLGDRLGLAKALNNLGAVYAETSRPEASLDYYREALAIYEQLGDDRFAASALNNIGLSLTKLGRTDEALTRFEKAMALQQRIGDEVGLAFSINNIGELRESAGELDQALDLYKRSMALRLKVGDRQGAAISRLNVGRTLSLKGAPGDAIEAIRAALADAEEMKIPLIQRDAQLALSETYEKLGDTRSALAAYKRYKELGDRILNESTGSKLAEMRTLYEVEKKDLEIDALRQDERMQRMLRNVLLVGAAMLAIIVALLYNRNRLKDRAAAEMRRANAADRAAQAERIRALRAELTHVSRATTMGELAAALAHELTQPLTAIRANAQATQRMIAAGTATSADIDEALSDIVRGASRSHDVIRRLRALFRRGEGTMEPLALGEVVREIEDFARADLERAGLSLRLECDDPLPAVSGDRIQLQQLLLNLVHNAAEAMAEGGENREVEVRLERAAEGGVTLRVRDHGPPVAEELIRRMFEPFYSTKEQGLGMGLPICKTIVEAHGGRIWAERHDAGGLSVLVSLPEVPAQEPSPAPES